MEVTIDPGIPIELPRLAGGSGFANPTDQQKTSGSIEDSFTFNVTYYDYNSNPQFGGASEVAIMFDKNEDAMFDPDTEKYSVPMNAAGTAFSQGVEFIIDISAEDIAAFMGHNGTLPDGGLNCYYDFVGTNNAGRTGVWGGGHTTNFISITTNNQPYPVSLGSQDIYEDSGGLDIDLTQFIKDDDPSDTIKYSIFTEGDWSSRDASTAIYESENMTVTLRQAEAVLNVTPKEDKNTGATAGETIMVRGYDPYTYAEAAVTIRILPVNDPPVWLTVDGTAVTEPASPGGQWTAELAGTYDEDSTYVIAVVADDPVDGAETFTYEAASISVEDRTSGNIIDVEVQGTAEGAEVTFIPDNNNAHTKDGQAHVVIDVHDGGGATATLNITVPVVNTPDAPAFDTDGMMDEKNMFKSCKDDGAWYTMKVYVTDEDGGANGEDEILTMSTDITDVVPAAEEGTNYEVSDPTWDAETERYIGEITVKPDNSWLILPTTTSFTFNVTVMDSDELTVTLDDLALDIENQEDSPTTVNDPEFDINGMTVHLWTDPAEDEDPGQLEYAWVIDGDPVSNDTLDINYTFTASGEHTVMLRVRDPGHAAETTDSKEIEFTVDGAQGDDNEDGSGGEEDWTDTTDKDDDGLPDWWEEKNGYDSSDPYDATEEALAEFHEEKAEAVDGDGTEDNNDDTDETDNDSGKNDFPWWLRIMVVVIIVVVIGLILIMKKKAQPNTPAATPEDQVGAAAPGPMPRQNVQSQVPREHTHPSGKTPGPTDEEAGAGPTCPSCGTELEKGWIICPGCKNLLE